MSESERVADIVHDLRAIGSLSKSIFTPRGGFSGSRETGPCLVRELAKNERADTNRPMCYL